ncbi:tRNA-specific adenosine deaminase, partial [Escherichia coli]|nr:tRNA-specific adenosine deaminase [Escherichia coli]
MVHEFDAWMDLALAEARKALATDDVPIGAVILSPEGEVLATGRNEREAVKDPTAHAEVVAIRNAVKALEATGQDDGWR